MQKISVLLLYLSLFISFESFAQGPQSISYQAVARNSSGFLIVNQSVSLRFTIHDLTSNGPVLYREIQTGNTNGFGQITANIGQGIVVIGTFTSINWGIGNKFIQVELDATGGSSYINMGTQQMLSVPYSLYSNSCGTSWNLNGNSNISPSSNFIGTIDDQPLKFKVHDIQTGLMTSNNNLFLGKQAGNNVSTGQENTLIGLQSGFNLTSGNDNIFIGLLSGYNYQSSQSPNIFIGSSSGYSATTGFDNNFLGSGSGFSITSGHSNDFFGESSGHSNMTGNANAFFGSQSGYNNTASNNTFCGYTSGHTNSTGTQNSFFGHNSGYNNTIGSFNTFIGQGTGLSNVDDNLNTYIGYHTDGVGGITNSTAIGANTQVTLSNSIVLGNNANVGIGISSPSEKLDIFGKIKQTITLGGSAAHAININTGNVTAINISHSGTGGGLIQGVINSTSNTSNAILFQNNGLGRTIEIDQNTSGNLQTLMYLFNAGSGKYIDASGNAYLSVGGNTWVNSSDKRKKSNIEMVDNKNILNKIVSLPIYQWNYTNEKSISQHIGPMAEDFYNIFNVGYDSISISTIDPAGVSLAAIKELAEENAILTNRLNNLQNEIDLLKTLVIKENNTVIKITPNKQ